MSRRQQPGTEAGTIQQDRDQEVVEIDRSDAVERYRYVCPNGHVDWDRTNNHIWCATCRQQNENGRDVDPEHYAILDKRADQLIDWGQIRLAEDKAHPRY